MPRSIVTEVLAFFILHKIQTKPMFNYNNVKFRGLENTENGEVSSETIFTYHQKNNLIWGEYEGGEILKGTLVGYILESGQLDFQYTHLNKNFEYKRGKCLSIPIRMANGKLRLMENWQWINGDFSTGNSIIEEI